MSVSTFSFCMDASLKWYSCWWTQLYYYSETWAIFAISSNLSKEDGDKGFDVKYRSFLFGQQDSGYVLPLLFSSCTLDVALC